MLTLILALLVGLLFSYFSVANTQTVGVNLANNLLTIPLFMLVIGSVLIGLLISAVISAIDSLSANWEIWSRERKLTQKDQAVNQLSAKVRDLEVENARLKGEHQELAEHNTYREEPKCLSFFDRLRYHSAT